MSEGHVFDLDAQLQACREVFGEELPLVELPLDHARPSAGSFFREQASSVVDVATTARLDELAAGLGAVRFDLIVGALAGIVDSLGSQDTVILGTATANAKRDGGQYHNGVLLRVELAGATDSSGLATAGQKAVREAGLRRDVPLSEALAVSDTTGDALRVIVLPDGVVTHLCPDGAELWDLQDALGEHGAAADLVLVVAGQDECELVADYDAEIFEAASVGALLERLGRLIDGMADGPETALADISLLSDAEQQLLDGWNATEVDYPRQACVHELIAQQVMATPNAVALRFRDRSLTYAQLDARAESLAAMLQQRGVGPDVMVGLWIPRSMDMLIGVLAVLKAGGAFVPMDPTYPASRLAYMREDSGAAVVLSRSDVPGAAEVDGVMLVDQLTIDEQSEAVESAATESNLAYVIYTSGSTGNPKGVMVEHQQAVNFFAGMDDRVGADPGRWLAVTSLSFDISVLELLWTLARGFEVVIHSTAEESVSGGVAEKRYDAHGVDFSLFYFGSDDGEAADLQGSEKYRLLTEGARFADRAGFNAVWTPERHFHIFGGMFPSPAVAGSALAMITDNIQIRSGSLVLPLHDPVRIAEEWQLVDNLSDGRVAMSFASGWQPNDFVFKPENYEDRHDVMFEGIETVKALWRGESRTGVGGDGKDVEFITRPRPVQPELPVWVTAGGALSTFERAGAAGANILTHLLGQSLEELGEKIGLYRRAYAAAGHPGKGTVSLMLHAFVGPDADAVRVTVHGPLKSYLKGSVSLFKPFAEALGLDMNNLNPEDEAVLAEHAFDRYYDTSGLFGTPESCLERVQQVKQLGVDEVACLIDFGIARQEVLDHLPFLEQLLENCRATAVPAADDFSIPGLIRTHDATHFQCTPSMAGMLLADAPSRSALATLDVMLVGGEAFPIQIAQQLKELLPEGRIINMYGPTETTIWAC